MNGRALIDHGRLLDLFEIEAYALAETVQEIGPDLRIPACPGLTVGETARHIGSVYRMALRWIRSGDSPESWQREPAADESAADYVRAGARALVDELSTRDPAEPCSTWWAADSTFGFWRRRMAHETTIHRTDVQAAAGRVASPITDDVAIDGVDEVLTLWFTHRLAIQGVTGTRDGSVAIRTGGRVWMARVTTGGTAAWRGTEAEVERANAVVTGPPAVVYRWLWGRLPDNAVSRDGDLDSVAQFWALLRLATR